MSRSEEGKIQDKIAEYLEPLYKKNLLIYEKRQAGGFNYKEGRADIWVTMRSGLHVEFEVKTPWGELRTAQVKWINDMKRMDIPCYVVTCVADVRSFIEPILNFSEGDDSSLGE